MTFTELDPTLLAILGATVMGLIQAFKPFIPERYVLTLLAVLATVFGVVLALSVDAENLFVQSIANIYFITVSASGSYSIAKSTGSKATLPKYEK